MMFERPFWIHVFGGRNYRGEEWDRNWNMMWRRAGTEGMREDRVKDGHLVLGFRPEARWYTVLGECFDGSTFGAVEFIVRGRKGGEKFKVGIEHMDESCTEKSVSSVPVTDYVKVRRKWKTVRVPMSDFPGLDRTRINAIVLHGFEGEGTIEIDNVVIPEEKKI